MLPPILQHHVESNIPIRPLELDNDMLDLGISIRDLLRQQLAETRKMSSMMEAVLARLTADLPPPSNVVPHREGSRR